MKKPHIIDFRSNKIEGGGLCAFGVFRRHLSANSKKSKYETVVQTAEDLAREDAQARGETKMDAADTKVAKSVASKKSTKEEMEELAMLTSKMSLEKQMRRKAKKAASSAKEDFEMADEKMPSIQIKSKTISKRLREKNRFKKSKKQLLH